MRPISEILTQPLGVWLRLLAMLLLLGQITVLLLTASKRRGRAALIGCLLHLCFGLISLPLLLDGAYRLTYLPYTRLYLPAVRWVQAQPWAALAGVELASGLFLGASLWRIARFSRTHPSAQSVKQTVDLLPTGICISDETGQILLSNLKMNEVLRAVTGSVYTGADELWAELTRRGTAQGEQLLVRLPDGTALLASRTTLTVDGAPRVQITAEDVTAQYHMTEELRRSNERLRELQRRMRRYQEEQRELVLRQELLSARATVHDQLGSALLTGKYHLEHPESSDPKMLRLLLEQLNRSLLPETEPSAGALDEALRTAARFGVAVTVAGEVPKDEALRQLLAQAITECAANTVKHAGGSRLEVTVSSNGFALTNDGKAPTGEVVPNGGLRSLELAAAQAGCRVELESAPRFRLRIKI